MARQDGAGRGVRAAISFSMNNLLITGSHRTTKISTFCLILCEFHGCLFAFCAPFLRLAGPPPRRSARAKSEPPHPRGGRVLVMVGTHRRMYVRDVLAYKGRRDSARRKAFDDLARQEMDEELYERAPLDPDAR